MVDPTVTAAADRLTANLEHAKEHGYLNDAWYFYMHKNDIIRLINFVRDQERSTNGQQRRSAVRDVQSPDESPAS